MIEPGHPEWPAWRSCAQKQPFQSRKVALDATRHFGRAVKPYRCARCGLWHLASKKERT